MHDQNSCFYFTKVLYKLYMKHKARNLHFDNPVFEPKQSGNKTPEMEHLRSDEQNTDSLA